jgi:hypothetical protein
MHRCSIASTAVFYMPLRRGIFFILAVSATGFVTAIRNSKLKVALAINHSTAQHSIATHTQTLLGAPPPLSHLSLITGGKGHLIFICHHHLDQF